MHLSFQIRSYCFKTKVSWASKSAFISVFIPLEFTSFKNSHNSSEGKNELQPLINRFDQVFLFPSFSASRFEAVLSFSNSEKHFT